MKSRGVFAANIPGIEIMPCSRGRTLWFVLPLMAAPLSGASAGAIPFANSGFESPHISAGGFLSGEPTGWSCTGGGLFGVLSPSMLNAYDVGQCEGSQIGWTNSSQMEKRLPASIKGPGAWTLRWKVGRRPNVAAGVHVRLFAGAVLLGEVLDTVDTLPPSRTMAERAILASIPEGSPTVGSLLRIVVSKVAGGGTQSNFDDFRLEADNPGPGCPADLNVDLLVDDRDFSLFVERYNELLVRPDGLGDLNYDSLVDDSDFSFFVIQYNDLECPQ